MCYLMGFKSQIEGGKPRLTLVVRESPDWALALAFVFVFVRAAHTAIMLQGATAAADQDSHMPVDVMLSQPDAGVGSRRESSGFRVEGRGSRVEGLARVEGLLVSEPCLQRSSGVSCAKQGFMRRLPPGVPELCVCLSF